MLLFLALPALAEPPAKTKVEACVEACLQRNMARAEAFEHIQAGCLGECGAVRTVVTKATEVPMFVGSAVTLHGVIKVTKAGAVVMVGDEAVWVGPALPDAWKNWLGLSCAVSGKLITGPHGNQLVDFEAPQAVKPAGGLR